MNKCIYIILTITITIIVTPVILTQPPYTHRVMICLDSSERPTKEQHMYGITQECVRAIDQASSIVIANKELWKHVLIRARRYQAMIQMGKTEQKSLMYSLPKDTQINVRHFEQAYEDLENHDISNIYSDNILAMHDAHCFTAVQRMHHMYVYMFDDILIFIPEQYYKDCIQAATEDAKLTNLMLSSVHSTATSIEPIQRNDATIYTDAEHDHKAINVHELLLGIKLHNGVQLNPETYCNIDNFLQQCSPVYTNIVIPWHTMCVNRKDVNLLQPDRNSSQHTNETDINELYIPRFDIIMLGHGNIDENHYIATGHNLETWRNQHHCPSTPSGNFIITSLHLTNTGPIYDQSENHNSEPSICKITPAQMQRMLQFCSYAITTRSIWYIGCSTGYNIMNIYASPHVSSPQYDAFPHIDCVGITTPNDGLYLSRATVHPSEINIEDNGNNQYIHPVIQYGTMFHNIDMYFGSCLSPNTLIASIETNDMPEKQPFSIRRKHTSQFCTPYRDTCYEPSLISCALHAKPSNAYNIILSYGYYPFIDISYLHSVPASTSMVSTLPTNAIHHIDELRVPQHWHHILTLQKILTIYDNPRYMYPKYICINKVSQTTTQEHTDIFYNVLIGICDKLYFIRDNTTPVNGIYAYSSQTQASHMHIKHLSNGMDIDINRKHLEHRIIEDTIKNFQNEIKSVDDNAPHPRELPSGLHRLRQDKLKYNAYLYAAHHIPKHGAARTHPRYK